MSTHSHSLITATLLSFLAFPGLSSASAHVDAEARSLLTGLGLDNVGGVVAGTTVGPIADLIVANKKITPDGFTRDAVLVNGQFPGPLITGWKDGEFLLNVHNKLTSTEMLMSTSVHWHGFFQKGSNWADGPSFVNQCPISPGHSFLYNFVAAGQAGTFWYHSHLSTQYCDGLRGAIVVYDPLDPHKSLYDVDNKDTVITLADWYHTPAPQLSYPTADSTLINGKGRYAGGPTADLAIVDVEHGKRYRFRLVNLSCDPNYTFQIDGHSMTVIEADTVSHKPYTVDSIQIFAGQRYSFVLNANQKVGNYWIRADPSSGVSGFSGGVNSAILRYKGASTAEPTTAQGASTTPLKETALVPLSSPGAPGKAGVGKADVNINLQPVFNAGNLSFTVNGASFVPPTVPVLLQILSGTKSAKSLLSQTGSLYELPANKVIELSIPGGAAGGPHPIHLHGHTFDVVRSAGSTAYNYANPPRRDVVSIGVQGDNVTIRFKTDNPGPWFLHCHIDWHLETGFAVVFAEEDTTSNWSSMRNPTSAWQDLCPIYDALPSSARGGVVPSATAKVKREALEGHRRQHRPSRGGDSL